mgnify:FL=1
MRFDESLRPKKVLLVLLGLLWATQGWGQIADRAEQELERVASDLADSVKGKGRVLALVKVYRAESNKEDRECLRIRRRFEDFWEKAALARGLTVIPRDDVTRMARYEEIRSSWGDMIDAQSRLEAGKELGADVLLVGRYEPETEQLFLRAVDAETGRVLAREECYVLNLGQMPISKGEAIFRVVGLAVLLTLFWGVWRRFPTEFNRYSGRGRWRGLKPVGWVFLMLATGSWLVAAWHGLGRHLW